MHNKKVRQNRHIVKAIRFKTFGARLDAPCFTPTAARCIRRMAALAFVALDPELVRSKKKREV